MEGLVDILELRANDPQQREMREASLSDIEFPSDGRVAEVGCGPGPVARALASGPVSETVVGVVPVADEKVESLRGISPISHLSRATRVRCRWRTTRSTSSCSTRRSATFPGPSSRWPRRHGFSLTAASSPSSMATMRRRPARAATLDPASGMRRGLRRIPRPRSLARPPAAQACARSRLQAWAFSESQLHGGAVLGRLHVWDRRPRCRRPARQRSHHARGSQHAEGRGSPSVRRRRVLRTHRVHESHRAEAQTPQNSAPGRSRERICIDAYLVAARTWRSARTDARQGTRNTRSPDSACARLRGLQSCDSTLSASSTAGSRVISSPRAT